VFFPQTEKEEAVTEEEGGKMNKIIGGRQKEMIAQQISFFLSSF
jgi:hypothetical protein